MTFIETKKISQKWFETCSDEDLDRFILGYNDGQGDHGFMTWKRMCEIYIECNVDCGELPKDLLFEEYLKLIPSRISIIDYIYKDGWINGNTSDMLYFDGKYKQVCWVE